MFEIINRVAFGAASIFLILLAGAMILYAGSQVDVGFTVPEEDVAQALLDAVGYTVIAIAVFDVGKYLFEEEAMHGREMRQAGEARRSLTKFLSTIVIAVFLEALVSVFEASKSDQIRTMIYPTLLLFGGVAMVVGLGVYQRLSMSVEKQIKGESHDQREDEDNGHEDGDEKTGKADRTPKAARSRTTAVRRKPTPAKR